MAQTAAARNRNFPDAPQGGRTLAAMAEALLAVEVAAAVIAVPAGCLWLGRRARRRGIRGSVLSPLEEIWDPVTHRTTIEVQVQAEREAPAPSPGEPPANGISARRSRR